MRQIQLLDDWKSPKNKQELMCYIHETPSGVDLLKHLFSTTPVGSDIDGYCDLFINRIARSEVAFRAAIEDNNAKIAMMMIAQPLKLTALLSLYHENLIKPSEFTDVLFDTWVDVEYPNQYGKAKSYWVELFSSPQRDRTYHHQSDKLIFDALGDVVTVYRGGSIEGLSWTLDEEQAAWFADRGDEPAALYRAEVKKEDIVLFSDAREESEVVILSGLMNVTKIN